MSLPSIPPQLIAVQHQASDPSVSAWVSANAGAGKTHVLAQRVIRLLLNGTDPAKILCLTFTKAGAAEMAVRVNEVLAGWVRMSDTALFSELEAIGAPKGPEDRARARTLFAKDQCPRARSRLCSPRPAWRSGFQPK